MKKEIKHQQPAQYFAFGKENYYYLLAGLGLILIGYMLMIGGGSGDPAVFSPEVFSARRITAGPIVSLSGFFFMIYAIMKKPKS